MLGTKVFKRKPVVIAIAGLFLMTMVMLSLSFSNRSFAAGNDTTEQRKTINVSGQAKVKASPDIAYITIGVEKEDKDAKVAQQSNATAMNSVIAKIKQSGVKEDDIKTINYSIYPKNEYNPKTGANKLVGYVVNNSVQVTVRDITKVGNIIDLAADSGANITNNISFGLSDYEKYYKEALKNAVSNAKDKANTMADVLGIKLGVPSTVSENGGYIPTVPYNNYNYEMKADAASTSIQSGQLEVTASVSMTYEY